MNTLCLTPVFRRAGVCLALTALLATGCDITSDDLDDLRTSEVTGRVVDNRGQPVAGATVRLYDLAQNRNFVTGSDINAAQAYVDKDAVFASTNVVTSAQTAADGTFRITGVFPSAFFAVASREDCSAGFAGFDEETGILNVNTLITPDLGLDFAVPTFELACATPPEVGPDGNSPDAPPFEPPAPDVVCDADTCAAAGGDCEEGACVVACAPARCLESGGLCVDGACVLPACNAATCAELGGSCEGDACVLTAGCDATACAEAGGTCSQDTTSCEIPPCFAGEEDCTAAGGVCSEDGAECRLPACSSDAECAVAQKGAYCTDAGDVALAACHPPEPGEIVPPDEAIGWTSFRLTDSSGNLLADASADNQAISAANVPLDGIVRVYGTYAGSATTAYVQVQSGGQGCADLPPRTDFVAVELVNGGLASGKGDFVEVFLHGGYQKLSLSTAAALGQGDRSFAVEVGEACTPPQHVFIVLLSWSAGPGQPADLDLNIWNGAGQLVFAGRKQAAWGQLAREEREGPGPEVFWSDDAAQGPFTIKVQFFSGRPRDIEGKVRILRSLGGAFRDDTYVFTVRRPKDVAEIGVFAAE
jgi:uncharacterized protein YfaP (DUF2135 family)